MIILLYPLSDYCPHYKLQVETLGMTKIVTNRSRQDVTPKGLKNLGKKTVSGGQKYTSLCYYVEKNYLERAL